jgi:flavin-dependent dehydrogenase
VANARASFARRCGNRWLAIGDARIAPDPLSGRGIIWAIDDAASAMELLTRMQERDLPEEMRARTLLDVEAHLFERSRVDLSEQRFKDDVYWSTSQGLKSVANNLRNFLHFAGFIESRGLDICWLEC